MWLQIFWHRRKFREHELISTFYIFLLRYFIVVAQTKEQTLKLTIKKTLIFAMTQAKVISNQKYASKRQKYKQYNNKKTQINQLIQKVHKQV